MSETTDRALVERIDKGLDRIIKVARELYFKNGIHRGSLILHEAHDIRDLLAALRSPSEERAREARDIAENLWILSKTMCERDWVEGAWRRIERFRAASPAPSEEPEDGTNYIGHPDNLAPNVRPAPAERDVSGRTP